jgi:hypothetical protein
MRNTNIALVGFPRTHSTHAELNPCQCLDNESLSSHENLPQDWRELHELLGNFDPITDLELFEVDYPDGQENLENTENPVHSDTAQGVPVIPQKDGHRPPPRGGDSESLSSRENLPQDLRELHDLLGNFDPITDLEVFEVDYPDAQENLENTENPVHSDTAQGVPVIPLKEGHNYPILRGRDSEVFPFLVPESLTQPIC